MFAHGEAVIHHRFTGSVKDSHNNVVPAYADPETIDGVAVAPGSSSEPRNGASQRVITQMSIYPPAGVVVDPRDQFTVRGKRYAVEGDMSGAWVDPFTGWAPGSEVTLKRVTG